MSLNVRHVTGKELRTIRMCFVRYRNHLFKILAKVRLSFKTTKRIPSFLTCIIHRGYLSEVSMLIDETDFDGALAAIKHRDRAAFVFQQFQ